MTDSEIEKKTQDYGYDLCSHCRECSYIYGRDKPCQHLIDAGYGFKDGYSKGFSDACELKNEDEKTVNPIKTSNSEFDDFFNSDIRLHEMLKTPEKTKIGELLKYAFEAGYKQGIESKE